MGTLQIVFSLQVVLLHYFPTVSQILSQLVRGPSLQKGEVLDRFDSLALSAPAFFLFTCLLWICPW